MVSYVPRLHPPSGSSDLRFTSSNKNVTRNGLATLHLELRQVVISLYHELQRTHGI